MAGAEAGEHQHAKQVDQRHDGGVGHRRQGDAGAAVDAGCKGGADVVVEADAALEHRGEVGTIVIDCTLVQHQ
ncbi:hypothetical protein D9M71_395980 [compost metagenome]